MQKYKGYTITQGYEKKVKCYYVNNCFIFLTVEEAKKFCDAFDDKSELYEMTKAL